MGNSSSKDSLFVRLEEDSCVGVKLEVKKHLIVVVQIIPGGWASKTNHIRVGDEILAIETRVGIKWSNPDDLLNTGKCSAVTLRRNKHHVSDNNTRKFSMRKKNPASDGEDFQFSYKQIIETGSASPVSKFSDVESIVNKTPTDPYIFGVNRLKLISLKDIETAIANFGNRDNKVLGIQFNNLACFCASTFKEKSLEWFQNSFENLKTLPNTSQDNSTMISTCLKNYAFLCMDMGQLVKAESLLLESLELDMKLNDPFELGIVFENLAVIFWMTDRFSIAQQFGAQAYQRYLATEGVNGIDTTRMKNIWES